MSPKKCLTSLNSCVFIFDSKLKVQCLSSVLSPKIKDPWLGITYKFARLHQEKKWFARQGEISLRRNISFSINTSNFLGDGDLSGTRCPSLCHFFYAFSRPAMSVSHVDASWKSLESWELCQQCPSPDCISCSGCAFWLGAAVAALVATVSLGAVVSGAGYDSVDYCFCVFVSKIGKTQCFCLFLLWTSPLKVVSNLLTGGTGHGTCAVESLDLRFQNTSAKSDVTKAIMLPSHPFS